MPTIQAGMSVTSVAPIGFVSAFRSIARPQLWLLGVLVPRIGRDA